MQAKILLLAASSLALSGCAGVITAWKNDPLQVYALQNPSVYTMTGDRRTAVILNKESPLRFCAESLPDAAVALGASSSAKAGFKGAEGSFSDTATAGLLQTFQRTENAEIFRQLGWNTCMAWAQGAISPEQYQILLGRMVDGGLEVMAKRASQPLVFPAPQQTTLLVAPGGTASPAPAPSPTPSPKPSPTPTPTPSP